MVIHCDNIPKTKQALNQIRNHHRNRWWFKMIVGSAIVLLTLVVFGVFLITPKTQSHTTLTTPVFIYLPYVAREEYMGGQSYEEYLSHLH